MYIDNEGLNNKIVKEKEGQWNMRLNAVLWRNFSKVGKTTKEYSNLPDSYIKRAMEKVSLWSSLSELDREKILDPERPAFVL